MSLKLCIAGATGHVGRELVKSIQESDEFELVACIGLSSAGKRLPDILKTECPDIIITGSIQEALELSLFEILIDYTTPEAVFQTVTQAIERGVHCVIGTSGLSDREYGEIDRLARMHETGVFAAGNFSITATLMQHFSQLAARYVPHWEIFDYASDTKVDAPSGTARELAFQLGAVAQPEFAVNPKNVAGIPESRGAGLNGSQVHSVRLPGFYSASETIFGLPGERLSIRHDSMSYAPYVAGTLSAARKVPTYLGLVRGMGNLLGLSAA